MDKGRKSTWPSESAHGCDNRRRARICEAACEFDLGIPLWNHHQEWAFSIRTLPIDPRAVPSDETVSNELLTVNLLPRSGRPFRHAHRESQISDFERLITLVRQRQRPQK